MRLLQGVVAQAVCEQWLAAIDERYALAAEADREYSIYSSSLRLRAVGGLPLSTVLSSVLRDDARRHLSQHRLCNVDESWVRRQYAPTRAPKHHAPHSWHQDGALRYDFNASIDPHENDAVLDMRTVWIPLTPCGMDAPGLELVDQAEPELIGPRELTDESLRRRYPDSAFVRPAMNAGDALIFDGSTLHRTHVAPSMTRDRTSVELRFFAEPPTRLCGDRYIETITL